MILYGAGEKGTIFVNFAHSVGLKLEAVIDGNPIKWGQYIKEYEIQSPSKVLTQYDVVTVIVAVAADKGEIVNTLKNENPGRTITGIYFLDYIKQYYKENQHKIEAHQVFQNKVCTTNIIFESEYSLGLGGVEDWTKAVCKKFNVQARTAYILTNAKREQVSGELRDNIIQLDVTHENSFSLTNLQALVDAMERVLPAIIVTSQPNDVTIAVAFLKKKYPGKIKLVAAVHGGQDFIYNQYMILEEYIDKFVCVSTDIKNEFVKRGVAQEKIEVVLLPVECKAKLNRSYSKADMPLKIGYAGRLVVVQKRMDLFLKLIERLTEKEIDFEIEIAGDGNYRKNMEEYVFVHNIQDNVKFVGKLDKDELYEFWKRQDVCLNIADYEGRSLSVLEAMANGAVPVVTATSGVNDDITEGINGFIVELGNYQNMAEKLEFLYNNKHLLIEMGNSAHDEISKKSNMQKHYEEWNKIFAEME